MPLVYNLTKVKNGVAWHEDGLMKSTTKKLLFYSMPIGYNAITEKNWKEIYTRIKLFEGFVNDPSDSQITTDVVKDHIGLVTNASPRTRASFLKHISSMMDDHCKYTLVKE